MSHTVTITEENEVTVTFETGQGPAGPAGLYPADEVWSLGNAPYIANSVVTHNSAIWLALRETSVEPSVSATDDWLQWLAATSDAVRYGVVQSLTSGEQLQARSNIDAQKANALLTAIAALSVVAGSMVYGTGASAVAVTATQAFGRSLLDTANAAAVNTLLGAGSANGLATLGSDGLIPNAQLPLLAITDTFVVASQVAMLALTAEKGDVAIRTDLNKTYVLSTNSPSTLADWKEMLTPTDAVLSVAGLTGAISASSLRTALGGTSGNVFPFLDGNNTWSGTNAFTRGLTVTQGTANESIFASTGGSNTGSNAVSAFNLAWTLNTSGSPDVFAIRVTDTARGASTRLFNIYGGSAGTASRFSIDRDGNAYATNLILGTGGINNNAGGSGANFDIAYTSGNVFKHAAAWMYAWSATSTIAGATDLTLSRAGAGVLQIGTTAADALGSLNLANLSTTGSINFGITTSSPFSTRINIGDAVGRALPTGATTGAWLYQASNDGAGYEAVFQGAGLGNGLVLHAITSGGTLASPTATAGGGNIALKSSGYIGGAINAYRAFSVIEIGTAVGTPATNADQVGAMKFYNYNGTNADPQPGMYLGYQPNGGLLTQILGLSNGMPIYQYNVGWTAPYNTIATDSESAKVGWVSNVYTISTQKTGTGTNRGIAISPANSILTVGNGDVNTTLKLTNVGTASTDMTIGNGGTNITVSGSGSALALNNTSGSRIDLLISGSRALSVDVNKNVTLNSAAIATNATNGFLYLASGAGAPTGTPTGFTGRVPIYPDTTNSKIWFYIGGAWKGVVVA